MAKIRGRVEEGATSQHQEAVVEEAKRLGDGEWSWKNKRERHTKPNGDRSGDESSVHVKLPITVNEDGKEKLEVQMGQSGAVHSSFQEHDKFFKRREKQMPNCATANTESHAHGVSPARTPKQFAEMREKAGLPVATTQSETQSLPFVKNVSLWPTIESMDIFQKIPQKPHFRPLEHYNQASREGQAIGCMITFSSIAEKIIKLRHDDPRGTIEENLETLSDLEKHGFDVQLVRDRLNQFLLLKDTQERFEAQVAPIDKEIIKRIAHRKDIECELEEIQKQIAELKGERLLARRTRKRFKYVLQNLDSEVWCFRRYMEKSIHEDVKCFATKPL